MLSLFSPPPLIYWGICSLGPRTGFVSCLMDPKPPVQPFDCYDFCFIFNNKEISGQWLPCSDFHLPIFWHIRLLSILAGISCESLTSALIHYGFLVTLPKLLRWGLSSGQCMTTFYPRNCSGPSDSLCAAAFWQIPLWGHYLISFLDLTTPWQSVLRPFPSSWRYGGLDDVSSLLIKWRSPFLLISSLGWILHSPTHCQLPDLESLSCLLLLLLPQVLRC